MSRICEFTGKRPAAGNNVSHSNRKTRTRWMPNLKQKTYLVPELDRSISVLMSTRAIRTIDKYSDFTVALMKFNDKKFSDKLKRLKREIYKRRVKSCLPKKTSA